MIPSCSKIVDHVHAVADTITLDETARHRRRMKMISDNGIEFLLDLPMAQLLGHGQGLVLSNGQVIEVRAEPEKLMVVSGTDPRHLLALSWQIGNRHLAAQIEADRIIIRHDEIIKQMLLGLGANVTLTEAPFSPEGGAYGGAHHNHHDHD